MGITGLLIRTAGAPALQRALPVYLGVLMLVAVIFGPTGMHPATVVLGMESSRALRLVLWSIWLITTAPAARAVVRTRALDYVRWLPVSRAHVYMVLGGLLLALQTPWVVLFVVGSGAGDAGGASSAGDAGSIVVALSALSAALLAAGVHAIITITPRSHAERALVLAWLGGAAVVVVLGLDMDMHAHIDVDTDAVALDTAVLVYRALAGLSMLALALPMAWRRAPERSGLESSGRVLPSPSLALAQVQLRGLWRGHGSVLVRGLLLVVLGAGAMVMLGRANELAPDQVAEFSAVMATLGLSLGCIGVSGPLAETERALGWVLDSTATKHDLRVAARLVTGMVVGAGFALVYSALVCWALAPDIGLGLRVTAGAVATGVALAFFARRITRLGHGSRRRGAAARGDGINGGLTSGLDGGVNGNRANAGRAVALMVLVLVAQMVAITWFGDIAVLVFLACGFAVSWERA